MVYGENFKIQRRLLYPMLGQFLHINYKNRETNNMLFREKNAQWPLFIKTFSIVLRHNVAVKKSPVKNVGVKHVRTTKCCDQKYHRNKKGES